MSILPLAEPKFPPWNTFVGSVYKTHSKSRFGSAILKIVNAYVAVGILRRDFDYY